jgi:predicted outer membrane protein
MAVKNVTFEVSADTTKAQASLNALVQQLEQIKKNSTISLSQSTGNIDAQIKDLTGKLDKLAADNQKRLNTETKNAVDSQKTKPDAPQDLLKFHHAGHQIRAGKDLCLTQAPQGPAICVLLAHRKE